MPLPRAMFRAQSIQKGALYYESHNLTHNMEVFHSCVPVPRGLQLEPKLILKRLGFIFDASKIKGQYR